MASRAEHESRKSLSARSGAEFLSNDNDYKLREREGWGTCRSKLQRFNKSIHPRGGVKSLTGREGEGEGEGAEPEDYDKPKKMKKIGEPVQCVPVHRFEIKYVNVTISFSFP